jgi:hypothetical protein
MATTAAGLRAVYSDRRGFFASLPEEEMRAALEVEAYLSEAELAHWFEEGADGLRLKAGATAAAQVEAVVAECLADPEAGIDVRYVDFALQDTIDRELRKPPAKVFTDIVKTTEVLAARVEAPRYKQSVLIVVLKLIGIPPGCEVLVVNSNYGAVAQKGFEHLVKSTAKDKPLAAPGRRNRQDEGGGGSFNSALEAQLKPPRGSAVWAQLEARGDGDRVYQVKYFPTSGSVQVCGVVLADSSDGEWAIAAWIRFVNAVNLLDGPAAMDGPTYKNLVNFKFQVRFRSARQRLNHQAVFDYINAQPADALPAPLIRAAQRPPIDGDRASFRFAAGEKTPRVNLFLGTGKINFLGFPTKQFASDVYDLLERCARADWYKFVKTKPVKDSAAEQLAELADFLENPAPRLRAAESPAAAAVLRRALDDVFVDEVGAHRVDED